MKSHEVQEAQESQPPQSSELREYDSTYDMDTRSSLEVKYEGMYKKSRRNNIILVILLILLLALLILTWLQRPSEDQGQGFLKEENQKNTNRDSTTKKLDKSTRKPQGKDRGQQSSKNIENQSQSIRQQQSSKPQKNPLSSSQSKADPESNPTKPQTKPTQTKSKNIESQQPQRNPQQQTTKTQNNSQLPSQSIPNPESKQTQPQTKPPSPKVDPKPEPPQQQKPKAQPTTSTEVNVPTVTGFHDAKNTHRHDGLPFSYSTLGVPIVGKTYNSTKVAPKDLQIFDNEVNLLFKPYNDTNCEFARYGDEWSPDGGYLVCKNFLNVSQGIINIGINGYDNFGCELSTVRNIPNYQYDCTNPRQPPCPTSKNNHFNNICVGAVTEKGTRTFYTIEDMLKSTNLTDKHIFMKIDCEGGEFPGLKYFPVDKLDNVDQITGELHFGKIYPEEWGMLDIFRTLMTKFVNVNLHMNNWGCFKKSQRKLKSEAVEFTLVNRKLITLKSESRSYAMHPLNKPNGRIEDCQMSDPVIPQPQNAEPPSQPENKVEPPSQPTSQVPPSIPIKLSNSSTINVLAVSEGFHEPNFRHKHQGLIFPYPTLGVPVIGKTYNATPVASEDLPLFDQQLNELLKPYNDTDCQYKRYGDESTPDGGYVICKNFINNSQGIINLGINGYDNFGCEISTVKNIPNYQFDCTNPSQPQCPSNNNNNHFNYICIGAVTEKSTKTFYTIEDMLKIGNLTDKRIILKIDCEGGQFSGLKYFPVDKLYNIDLIVGQLHFSRVYSEEWGILDIIRTLMTKFVNVNLHMNNYACMSGRKLKSAAVEFSLVNRNLIKIKSESRSYALNPLNKPNRYAPDCQMN